MKKFFGEFKKFITRGNVIDLAVGVIIGGAFTAIVNGISNNVLKPLINFVILKIMGGKGFEDAVTMLEAAYTTDETGAQVIDLANSIYIDWGALIITIINFFVTALVLFLIIRTINKMKEESADVLTKEDKAELKAKGIKISDKAAVKAYFDEKAKQEAEAKKAAEAAAAEAARLEKEANPSAETLLKEIRDLLKNKA